MTDADSIPTRQSLLARLKDWDDQESCERCLAHCPVDNDLSIRAERFSLSTVKLLLENLPASLQDQRETLAKCLEAMDRALPLAAVYLFGSHARGEARPDSDVDLCLVAEGASEQLKAAAKFREAMWGIHRPPPFTLIPITPQRLAEKKAVGDYFFDTVLTEGVLLATKN